MPPKLSKHLLKKEQARCVKSHKNEKSVTGATTFRQISNNKHTITIENQPPALQRPKISYPPLDPPPPLKDELTKRLEESDDNESDDEELDEKMDGKRTQVSVLIIPLLDNKNSHKLQD